LNSLHFWNLIAAVCTGLVNANTPVVLSMRAMRDIKCEHIGMWA
jgi:hypothetical protein